MPRFLQGDCLDVVPTLPAESVNLIMTSPPYADRREGLYEGIAADKYVEWFLPRAEEFKRVLRPDGSFILNIKEHIDEKGERHPYVIELILALRKQGWRWVEEYMWHKLNPFPGRRTRRLSDGWERCLHFSKTPDFIMYPDQVTVPIGKWAQQMESLSREWTQTHSGIGRNPQNWAGRTSVYPSNVFCSGLVGRHTGHPAAFPTSLPEFFIKLFTLRGAVVLDPFCGSGTTGLACRNSEREFIGIDVSADYVILAEKTYLDPPPDEEPEEPLPTDEFWGGPYIGENDQETAQSARANEGGMENCPADSIQSGM